MLKLHYNTGEDTYFAAQRFVEKYNLPYTFLPKVRPFQLRFESVTRGLMLLILYFEVGHIVLQRDATHVKALLLP